jgi:hypothetical protein
LYTPRKLTQTPNPSDTWSHTSTLCDQQGLTITQVQHKSLVASCTVVIRQQSYHQAGRFDPLAGFRFAKMRDMVLNDVPSVAQAVTGTIVISTRRFA